MKNVSGTQVSVCHDVENLKISTMVNFLRFKTLQNKYSNIGVSSLFEGSSNAKLYYERDESNLRNKTDIIHLK